MLTATAVGNEVVLPPLRKHFLGLPSFLAVTSTSVAVSGIPGPLLLDGTLVLGSANDQVFSHHGWSPLSLLSLFGTNYTWIAKFVVRQPCRL